MLRARPLAISALLFAALHAIAALRAAPVAAEQGTVTGTIVYPGADKPVFIHCQRGADRTGTIVACYRIRHDRWTAERALDEAEAHGMAWMQFGMKSFIRRFPSQRP